MGLVHGAFHCVGLWMALDWGEGLEKNSGIFSFAGVVDVLRACMWYARLNPQQPKEEHKHGESKENEKI